MTTGNQMLLPTEPQSVATINPDPLRGRLFLYGLPKTGKTTLAANWAPASTLILDLQHGTDLLPGEHFVQHINSWQHLEETIDAIVAPSQTRFKTIVIDTVDLAYKLADAKAAAQHGKVAAGEVAYSAGRDLAEGLFRRAISKLLGRRDLGVWFIGHAKTITDDKDNQMFVPELDKRVQLYIIGDCEHIFFSQRIGNRVVLHTGKTGQFEGGTRLDMPPTLDMDAGQLWLAMNAGIKKLRGDQPAVDGRDKADAQSEPVAV